MVAIICINANGEICYCPGGGGGSPGTVRIRKDDVPCSICVDWPKIVSVSIAGMTGYLSKFNGSYVLRFTTAGACYYLFTYHVIQNDHHLESFGISLGLTGIESSPAFYGTLEYGEYNGDPYPATQISNMIEHTGAVPTYSECEDLYGSIWTGDGICSYSPYGQPSTTDCSEWEDATIVVSGG